MNVPCRKVLQAQISGVIATSMSLATLTRAYPQPGHGFVTEQQNQAVREAEDGA
jgi:hypothetical protein